VTLEPGHYITLALAAIGFVTWLVRLEGRVNAQRENLQALDRDLATANAKADAESKAHRDTSDALIRVEEGLKHLTRLFEQQFTANAALRPQQRRRAEA
jgi:hypothetical protein